MSLIWGNSASHGFPGGVDRLPGGGQHHSDSSLQYHGDYKVELLALLSNTGRILVGFRFALASLEAAVDLSNIFPVEAYRGWKLTKQFWARDIAI
jgi:hypothetical protein